MTEISAAMVMQLRKISGQGMMDCKKALTESNGDIDQAMEILRKKGLATLAKRAGRQASEGLVVGKTSDDGKTVVLATLCCETDFVSKNDDFTAVADVLADYALACSADQGTGDLLATAIDGKKFSDCLTELVSKTGEKTEVGDYVKYTLDGPGFITTYIHFNNKVGAMLQIEASDEKTASLDALKQAAADIAMHVTAINPFALDKEGISPDIIEKEKAIYAEQVQNKPPNIVEKIIEGKLKKFFAEKCLLAQAFVKDDTKTVAEVIDQAGKQAGGQARIKRFVRFAVG